MTQAIPYIILLAGVWLLIIAAMSGVHGLFRIFIYQLIPAILGGMLIFIAAMRFLGGAL